MLNNEIVRLEFQKIGLFCSEEDWIHPKASVPTYEIIYVVEGQVHIEEQGKRYSLQPGDLILLRPFFLHQGFQKSETPTKFYWLHFYLDRYDPKFELPQCVRGFSAFSLFKELMHYSRMSGDLALLKDALTMHILALLRQSVVPPASKLVNDIMEWTRINADARLTVRRVAEHFGYNGEYLSRLVTRECGMSLKEVIDAHVMRRMKDYLCNTDYFVKEIAALLHFSDATSCSNFFKYHEKMTPVQYRNSHCKIHMNKK